jgi:cell pole-organizing protein PopZ
MEEILASIRRIISEDDPATAAEPAAPEAKVDPAPPREAQPAPTPLRSVAPAPPPLAASEEEEVLELTDPAPVESHGDLDVFTPSPAPAAAPPSKPPAPPAPAPERLASHDEEPLISAAPEDRVASHFGLLSKSLALPSDHRTLEDLVRELMRPLLKDWLDQHLAGIVEEKVQAEVERIARRR